MAKSITINEVGELTTEAPTLKFTIKNKQLTISSFVNYIEYVMDQVFTENEFGVTIYKPRYKDIAIKSGFLDFYTTFEFKEDIDENYKEYAGLDIFEYYELINLEQFRDLLSAIDEEIDFKKQQLLKQDNAVSTFVSELLLKQIEVQDLQKEILEQQKATNDLMTPEEQKAFYDKFMASGLTGESVVEAYLKSDTHKSKEQAIIDEKNRQIAELEGKVKIIDTAMKNIPDDHKKKARKPRTPKVVEIPVKEVE